MYLVSEKLDVLHPGVVGIRGYMAILYGYYGQAYHDYTLLFCQDRWILLATLATNPVVKLFISKCVASPAPPLPLLRMLMWDRSVFGRRRN